MARYRTPVLNRVCKEELSGARKIRALLDLKFGSLTEWGRLHGWNAGFVSMALSGSRPLGEVRQALANDLGIPREEVDAALDQERLAPAS